MSLSCQCNRCAVRSHVPVSHRDFGRGRERAVSVLESITNKLCWKKKEITRADLSRWLNSAASSASCVLAPAYFQCDGSKLLVKDKIESCCCWWEMITKYSPGRPNSYTHQTNGRLNNDGWIVMPILYNQVSWIVNGWTQQAVEYFVAVRSNKKGAQIE